MPNWTAEQQRAIDANGNLLVSAGAGSGKTAVLTARIVRLIRGGESINSVLCVTFTNAAAAEMKANRKKPCPCRGGGERRRSGKALSGGARSERGKHIHAAFILHAGIKAAFQPCWA